MKKILSNIRSKSPEFRFALSLMCAGILMAVIVGGYVAILASKPSVETDAPSPFSAIAGSIKNTVGASSSQKIQVIDVSQPSSANDESNPFGVQTQSDKNAPVAGSTDQISNQN